jgi:hypothetical protein
VGDPQEVGRPILRFALTGAARYATVEVLQQGRAIMKRTVIAACAVGTMLVATSPSAFAGGWQPSSGSVTVDAVNPCTGASADYTLSWERSLLTATRSGTRVSTSGTYTASDGSAGTVRTTSSTTATKDGYVDTFRRVLVGRYEGRPQRMTFVFRIAVGQESDVPVTRTDASCGG